MSINEQGAFVIGEEGVAARDDDGNILYYITGGNNSPIGTQATAPTLYIQRTNGQMWMKFGNNAADWKLLPRSEANFPFAEYDCGIQKTDLNFSARNFAVINYTNVPVTVPISLPDSGSDLLGYSLSSGELQFNQKVDVWVHYQFNTLIFGADTIMFYSLEINTGGNWTQVQSSFISQEATLVNGFALHSPSREVRINANKGDRIRMRANQFQNLATAQALGSGNVMVIRPVKPSPEVTRVINAGVITGNENINDLHRSIDCGVITA